jgi:hypothetical protein
MAGASHLRLEIMMRYSFDTNDHIPTLMEAPWYNYREMAAWNFRSIKHR